MRARRLFALIAVTFFATPLVLYLAGVEAEQFENRRLADAPSPSQGWDAFAQASRFLVDRMPLRDDAVRANTRIWTDMLGTDPDYRGPQQLAADQALPFAGSIEDAAAREGRPRDAARARSGSGGWLYVDEELSLACDESIPDRQVLRRWGAVVRAVRARGHPSAMLIAPAKASVYPEHLPREYPYDHCALDAKERFWRLMAREGREHGIVELRTELLRLKRHVGDAVFQRKDSHWATIGALELVDAALKAIDDGVRLKTEEVVEQGTVDYTGDLTVVGGDAERDERIEYGIERDADAPRVPGRTLLVCDSFAYHWFRLFKPYFENIRYISIRQSEHDIARAIRKSDRVIFEANELLFKAQADNEGSARAMLRALRESDRP